MLFDKYAGYVEARMVPGKPGIAFVEFQDHYQVIIHSLIASAHYMLSLIDNNDYNWTNRVVLPKKHYKVSVSHQPTPWRLPSPNKHHGMSHGMATV